MAMLVPPGFRFMPTDAELISYFLERKERGLPIACERITEKEVYGDKAPPWKVFGEDEPYWNDCDEPKKKMMIFAFTKLSKVGNSNKKMNRVAGCGTWEGKSVSQNVKNFQGRIIGKKRAFTFKPHKGFEWEMKGKGHWIMHEMSVDGYNYVVCRITRDLSKGLNYDDEQKESHRKRKLADQSRGEEEELEDSPHGKKLRSCGGSDIPSAQQTDDLIDLSLLFEDDPNYHEEEVIPSLQQTDLIDVSSSFLFDDDHYHEEAPTLQTPSFANVERFIHNSR